MKGLCCDYVDAYLHSVLRLCSHRQPDLYFFAAQGANILVDRSGEAKLADFGASRQLGRLGNPAGQGAQSLRGTPAFMVREEGV